MKNTENASKILKNGENYTERDEVYLEAMKWRCSFINATSSI